MPAKLGATRASSVTGAIIFDLGNVLIDFNHMIAAQRLSQFSDKSGRQIYDLFFDSELTGLFEEGKVTPGEFFLEVKKALNLKTDYAGFLPVWNEIFFLTPRNLEVYQLALLLKKHYKLALLSNINILHLDYLKKNFPVFDAFHCILASFELGLRKPAPLVYQKTLQILGFAADEVVYTDDRPELVESARAVGIKAFVFRGIEQLKKDFFAAGIAIESS